MTPIVLQHGLFGFGEIQVGSFKFGYFHGIDRAIGQRGHPVIISRVHPTGSIARRASQLKQNILRQLSIIGREKERVVIVAHSMGGLDARYMITKLGMDDRVRALVTITTPHRGSSYADWCLTHLGQRLGALKLFNLLNLDVEAVRDLTTASCARFNEQVPDAPAVRYFSVSAARPWHRVPPFFFHSHQVIQAIEGDNDGLVSVQSATWGEHLATWPADHLHVLNKRLVIELKEPTGDMTPRYMKLLDLLCERGLCDGRAGADVSRRTIQGTNKSQ
jgi:triacylglycerol lipase